MSDSCALKARICCSAWSAVASVGGGNGSEPNTAGHQNRTGQLDISLDREQLPARPVLAQHLSDPLLIDMLLCPLMYYGSAVEDDMEFGQFVTMFKSIFLEGFARPEGGVRTLTDLLKARLREVGGEVRFKRGVRRILSHEGQTAGVELEDGQVLEVGSLCMNCEAQGITRILPTTIPRFGQASRSEAGDAVNCRADACTCAPGGRHGL